MGFTVTGSTSQLVRPALGTLQRREGTGPGPRGLTNPLLQGGGGRGFSSRGLTLLQGTALVIHAAALELAQQVKEALLVGGRGPGDALGGGTGSQCWLWASHRWPCCGHQPLTDPRTQLSGCSAWAEVRTLLPHPPLRLPAPPPPSLLSSLVSPGGPYWPLVSAPCSECHPCLCSSAAPAPSTALTSVC